MRKGSVVSITFLTLLIARPTLAQDKPILIDTIGGLTTEVRVLRDSVYNQKKKNSENVWFPQPEFFLQMDNIESDDVVEIQLMQKKKKLGKPWSCQYKNHFKDIDLDHVFKMSHPDVKTLNIAHYECPLPRERHDKDLLTGDGEYAVSLTYKQTLAGKSFADFALLKFRVTKLLEGARNSPYVTFGQNYDNMLFATTVERDIHRGASMNAGMLDAQWATTGGKYFTGHLNIRTWLRHTQTTSRLNPKMSCLLNGKKVFEQDGDGKIGREFHAYPKKGAAEMEFTTWERWDFYFQRAPFSPGFNIHPKTKQAMENPRQQAWFYLDKNPGEYKCVLTAKGDVLREIYFKVDDKGDIVGSECDKAIVALPHVHLARVVEKKSLAPFDKKAKSQAFFRDITWPASCPQFE